METQTTSDVPAGLKKELCLLWMISDTEVQLSSSNTNQVPVTADPRDGASSSRQKRNDAVQEE